MPHIDSTTPCAGSPLRTCKIPATHVSSDADEAMTRVYSEADDRHLP
jgi:hypothetical protein